MQQQQQQNEPKTEVQALIDGNKNVAINLDATIVFNGAFHEVDSSDVNNTIERKGEASDNFRLYNAKKSI